MTWAIEFSGTSLRALKKIDRPVSKRILRYMGDVSALNNPRARGKALTAPPCLACGATEWATTALSARSEMRR